MKNCKKYPVLKPYRNLIRAHYRTFFLFLIIGLDDQELVLLTVLKCVSWTKFFQSFWMVQHKKMVIYLFFLLLKEESDPSNAFRKNLGSFRSHTLTKKTSITYRELCILYVLPPEGSSTSSLNLESSWTDENALYICVLELKSTLCAHMSMVVVVASRFRAFVVLYNPHTT